MHFAVYCGVAGGDVKQGINHLYKWLCIFRSNTAFCNSCTSRNSRAVGLLFINGKLRYMCLICSLVCFTTDSNINVFYVVPTLVSLKLTHLFAWRLTPTCNSATIQL